MKVLSSREDEGLYRKEFLGREEEVLLNDRRQMSSQKFLNGMYKKLFVNFTENLWGLKEELYYMACRTL